MELCWSIVSALFVGFVLFCYFFMRHDHFLKAKIPHIKPYPIIGNMSGVLLRRKNFQDLLNEMYSINPSAKYVGMYDFNLPVLIIRDLDLIKSITVKNFDHFVDRRGFVDAEYEPIFGNNLSSLRGDHWREIRNLLTPAFTSSKMKGMCKLMSSCAQNFVNSVRSKIDEDASELDSKDIFTRYTMDTIATCAFGISVDSMKDPTNVFYMTGKKATNFEGKKALFIFIIRSFPTLARLLRLRLMDQEVETFFCDLIRETIKTRDEQNISRPDMIQLMMETRGASKEMSIEMMTAQAFIFFIAGFETIATHMAFLAHDIAAHPQIQAKLHEEIDAVLAKSHGQASYEDINSMSYLEAVINESHRVYSVAGFIDRICTKEFELPPALPGGDKFKMKVGDNLWIPLTALHRDPQYFPNPDVFDPERFIGGDDGVNNMRAYLPFGVGPRMCIANRFALLETKVMIFYLLSKFSLKPGKKMILPVRLSKKTIVMKPEGGFWLQLTARK